MVMVAIGLTGCQDAEPQPRPDQQAQSDKTVATPGAEKPATPGTEPSNRSGYRRTGRVIRDTDDPVASDGSQDAGTKDSRRVDEDGSKDDASVEKADVVQLKWDAPTHRENGEGLYPAEIREYIISYGKSPDKLRFSITVDSDGTRSMKHAIKGLDEGTWYFTVQTVDLANNISQRADVVSKSL
mgnify:CR=1 FL=1